MPPRRNRRIGEHIRRLKLQTAVYFFFSSLAAVPLASMLVAVIV
jgi:hypothetical protein